MRHIPGFRWPSPETLARAPRYCGVLLHKDVVRGWLPMHPAQMRGAASGAMLDAIRRVDADAIRALPPLRDDEDDWVYIEGRHAIHSALWEALCEIIAPRQRAGPPAVDEAQTRMLEALVARRGVGRLLRGCMWEQRNVHARCARGSFRRSMSPISAVIDLCTTPFIRYDDVYCVEAKGRRAAACMRVLVGLGARATQRDLSRARRAAALYPHAEKCLGYVLAFMEDETQEWCAPDDLCPPAAMRRVAEWLLSSRDAAMPPSPPGSPGSVSATTASEQDLFSRSPSLGDVVQLGETNV